MSMLKSSIVRLAAASVAICLATPILAQGASEAQIKASKVADDLYRLEGRGGHMALFVGSDGAFLVDDQIAPLSDKIKAAIGEITDKPVRFVINTHWHGDHVGGNAAMAEGGATVVAHENVRRRLTKEQFMRFFPRGDKKVPPASEKTLPIVTFTEEMSFYLNGQKIRVAKMPNAHTDGDSIVQFTGSDVIHAGDALRHQFPFIDIGAGGSLKGTIELTKKVLELMGPNTKIIAGHSPVMGKKEITDYLNMLVEVEKRIAPMVTAGKSEADVVAAKPLQDLDAKWGGGFVKMDLFVKTVYADLKG